MKKCKKFGLLLLVLMMFAVTGCSKSFCNDEDVAAIKAGIRTQLDTNGGSSYYASPLAVEGDYSDAMSKLAAGGITADVLVEKGFITDNSQNYDWTILNVDPLDEAKYAEAESLKSTYVDYIYTTYHPKACLVTEDHEDKYSGATIKAKTFNDAFKLGLINMLAFPFSWAMTAIGNLLGGSGIALLFGVILVTFIIRALALLLTFKQTKQSQKIQALQPQLNAIQEKYAGKTDQNSKMQQSQEMMALYQKYNINPASSLVAPFVTLPIFIAIYGAVQQNTAIYESDILGLSLGANMGQTLLTFNWLAIVIFILMAASQFVAMNITQWMAKKKAAQSKRNTPKSSMNSMMKFMPYTMLIMVVIVSFSLPIAMSIYWLASSVFSIIQAIVITKMSEKEVAKSKEFTPAKELGGRF